MSKTLQTVGPILAGVVLWNLVPGLAAKLILLCTAVAVVVASLLLKRRGTLGSGERGRDRVAGFMVTAAVLLAATLSSGSISDPAREGGGGAVGRCVPSVPHLR